MGRPLLNLLGMRFGRLVVTEPAKTRFTATGQQTYWRCLCDCGMVVEVQAAGLRSGTSTSCGCWKRECHKVHGLYGTPTYRAWQAMMRRCTNPKSSNYSYYGGRGITVAPEFRSFKGFLEHLGTKPPGMTLDRINNDGPYAQGNVRWADMKTQSNNRRPRRAKESDAAVLPH